MVARVRDEDRHRRLATVQLLEGVESGLGVFVAVVSARVYIGVTFPQRISIFYELKKNHTSFIAVSLHTYTYIHIIYNFNVI